MWGMHESRLVRGYNKNVFLRWHFSIGETLASNDKLGLAKLVWVRPFFYNNTSHILFIIIW